MMPVLTSQPEGAQIHYSGGLPFLSNLALCASGSCSLAGPPQIVGHSHRKSGVDLMVDLMVKVELSLVRCGEPFQGLRSLLRGCAQAGLSSL